LIKHIIFTSHDEAMLMCGKLAATLTLQEKRSGKFEYCNVTAHPDGTRWSVIVDTAKEAVMGVVGTAPLVLLDETWMPESENYSK